MNEKRFFSATSVANTIALAALIAAIVFNGIQVKIQNKTLREQNETLANQERIASADYMLKLSDELNSSEYGSIMTAIEKGTEYTRLDSKGADPHFTHEQVEDYIGNFETIGDLVNEGVINKDMAYQEFDYDVVIAWCNNDVQKDVQNDIAGNPGEVGENQYWYGFQTLAVSFLQKDRQTCQQYENHQ